MLPQILPSPYHTILMDFITGLPKSQGVVGFDAVLVVVDKYMCYGHFILCLTTITTLEIVDLLWTHITKHLDYLA